MPPVSDMQNREINRLPLLLALGMVGAISLGISLGPQRSSLNPGVVIFLAVLGTSYTAIALASVFSESIASWLRDLQAKVGRWFNISQHGLITLVAGVGLSLIGSLTAGAGPQASIPFSLPLWLLGIVLIHFSLRAGDAPPFKIDIHPGELGILILLLAAGGILRVIELERMPYVLSGDEGSFGLIGWEFVQGSRDNLLGLGWFSFPAFYPWLLSLSQAILGRTTFAIRLISAIAGTLTIGAVYLAGRFLFDRKVGLIGAAWLTTYHYHVFFSRIAYNNIFDGFTLMLCIIFLYRGWVENRRNDFLLMGISLGFSQYFYTTSHAIPIILLIWIPWLHHGHGSLKQRLPHLLAGLLLACSVALPLIALYLLQPGSLTFTAGRVSLLDPGLIGPAAEAFGMTPIGLILEQTLVTGLGITVSELQGIYLDAGQPMLFGLSAVFFTIGLFLLLVRWKRSRSAILLVTMLLSIVIGGLSIQAPSSQRLILLPPTLALTIAATLTGGYDWLNARLPQLRLFLCCLLVIPLAWMSYENTRQLFLDYFPNESYGSLNGEVTQEIIDLLEDETPDVEIFFIGGERMQFDSIPSISYLRPGYSASSIMDPDDFQLPQTILERTIFIILPEQSSSPDQITTNYPGSSPIARYNRHGRLLFYVSIIDPTK